MVSLIKRKAATEQKLSISFAEVVLEDVSEYLLRSNDAGTIYLKRMFSKIGHRFFVCLNEFCFASNRLPEWTF